MKGEGRLERDMFAMPGSKDCISNLSELSLVVENGSKDDRWIWGHILTPSDSSWVLHSLAHWRWKQLEQSRKPKDPGRS